MQWRLNALATVNPVSLLGAQEVPVGPDPGMATGTAGRRPSFPGISTEVLVPSEPVRSRTRLAQAK